MTGFIAGAVSASFTGKLADRYGRRLACLVFCVLYSLSCVVLFSNDIIVLFVGRALGGASTTILYSCFESWMVTEYNVLFPDEPASTLSGIFSTMTTLNSVVAVLAGILAEWFADLAGTQKAPFMSAIGCLALAFMAIWKNWVSINLQYSCSVADPVSREKTTGMRQMYLSSWKERSSRHLKALSECF